jgi:hypothetical protein
VGMQQVDAALSSSSYIPQVTEAASAPIGSFFIHWTFCLVSHVILAISRTLVAHGYPRLWMRNDC